MGLGSIIDPFKIIASAFDFVANAYKSFRGFKLLVFGTTGVGKTTFWKYLQTENLVDATQVNKTIDITPMDKFRIRSVKLSFVKVGIQALDLPGDPEYRSTWEEALKQVKPDGIIFLLDHVEDPDKDLPEGLDPNRLKENREAFDFLTDLLLKNKEIANEIQAFAIGVNKTDILDPKLSYGKVLEKTGINTNINRLNELENCRSTAFGISALTGGNVIEMMRWMVSAFAGN